jgi:hypothetical protein
MPGSGIVPGIRAFLRRIAQHFVNIDCQCWIELLEHHRKRGGHDAGADENDVGMVFGSSRYDTRRSTPSSRRWQAVVKTLRCLRPRSPLAFYTGCQGKAATDAHRAVACATEHTVGHQRCAGPSVRHRVSHLHRLDRRTRDDDERIVNCFCEERESRAATLATAGHSLPASV